MPTMIIVAGPNGEGKTSFADAYLAGHQQTFEYINADEIARELASSDELASEAFAARTMLQRIEAAVVDKLDIMLETTLATRSYVNKIRSWQSRGYHVGLIYLRLPKVAASIERVRRRVAAGGHDIPEITIRRRFPKSVDYLETLYKPIVDEWYVWESAEGEFIPAEAWDQP